MSADIRRIYPALLFAGTFAFFQFTHKVQRSLGFLVFFLFSNVDNSVASSAVFGEIYRRTDSNVVKYG